jgi:hypothetical protein
MYAGGQLVRNTVDGSRPGYSGRKGSAENAINRRTKLADDYNKIVEYALNNRKIKNFSKPVEVTIDGKLTTIDELPTVNEWADMNNVDRSTLSTRKGSLIPVKRTEVYKTIVDETIKLNNQTFTYSSPSDIAMDIGFTKNQGRGTGVEDLLKKGDVTKLLSKDEIVSNYIQHLIDKDAPLKDFTNNSIFKHVNSRNADLIKKNKDFSLSIPDSRRTIDFNKVSKIMKANHPELFAKIGRDGQIPFLSRSIQNKTDLGNIRLSEAFETTESGNIFFNEAKAKNINVKRALANITAETDILQGKLKLDQKSLAISNAQDKMVTDLNKYIRENPNVILDNPQFRNLAATRFEDGKFIIDENSKLIDDRLNRYIKRGFFSTDHKVSKRTGKLNIEFPTNKQIVPTFINGPIRSMENYIANNISKYDTDPLIKNNIDEIVNVAKTNNFTVNVPKENSKIFGTNRTNVGAIADMATVSADGTVLTSYDNQLKKFNFDIDKIPELSNVKNIDYTEVDKSKLQKTLDTKLTTAQGYTDSLDFNKQAEAGKTGKINPKEMSVLREEINNAVGELACGDKLAGGGRIKFSSGSSCNVRGRKILTDAMRNGIKSIEPSKQNLVKKILTGSANLVRGVLDPKEFFKLKNLIGFPAAAAAAVYDTVMVADDMIRKGQPFDEAAGNEMLAGMLNLQPQSQEAKRVLADPKSSLSPAAKDYAQMLADMGEYNNIVQMKELPMKVAGMPGDPKEQEKLQKKLDALDKKISGTSTSGELDYLKEITERYAKDKAGSYVGKDGNEYGYTRTNALYDDPDKTDAPSFFSGELKPSYGDLKQEPGRLPEYETKMIPAYVSQNYQTMKEKPMSQDSIDVLTEINKDLGVLKDNQNLEDMYYTNERFIKDLDGVSRKQKVQGLSMLDEYKLQNKWMQALSQPGMKGTQFAEGGITGLRSKYEYKK